MTGKKITFSSKPNFKNTEKIIDQWISSDTSNIDNNIKNPNPCHILKRTTIYLPEELRQKLKLMAVEKYTTMTDLIINALDKYLE